MSEKKTQKTSEGKAEQTSKKKTQQSIDQNQQSWENLDDSITAAKVWISEDEAEILPKRLEKKVVDICEEYNKKTKREVKDPEAELNELTNLAKHYSRHINFREGTVGGAITTYRIHQGSLFLVIKKVVKFAGKKWQDWFDENFPKRELRSAQDYMRLAKAPDAIEYVALGKDRLRQILKYSDNKEKDTPIGKFFEKKGIDWQNSNGHKLDDLKFQVDVALSHQRLISNKLEGIPKEKVEEFLTAVGKIGGQHLMELKFEKANGGHLIECVDEMIQNNGKRTSTSEPERNGHKLNNAVQKFIDKIDEVLKDTDSFENLDPSTIVTLGEKIEALRQHLTPN